MEFCAIGLDGVQLRSPGGFLLKGHDLPKNVLEVTTAFNTSAGALVLSEGIYVG